MRILIVDDSRTMRMIVKRTLRQAGFDASVEEAEDGVEALELIQRSPPDLILSDWNMPNMTGPELLKSLNDDNIRVPFGFVTSEGSSEMREQATAAGARFLIAKPFNADTLKRALDSVVP